jgi:hypothetical protein
MTQTCVISLDAVASTLEAPVEIEFWPLHLIADRVETAHGAASNGSLAWPEPIVDHKIDLGPVIYETLATALDPYPKREGVSFQWSEGSAETNAEPAQSPFEALRCLK